MEQKKQSQTAVFYPIIAAVRKADDVLGPKRKWLPVNPEQRAFLVEHYGPCVPDLPKIPEIQSVVSFNAEEINRFLKERGFSIKLNPFKSPEDFGTASILDVLVEWLEEGMPISIQSGKKEYPGVRLHGDGVSFLISSIHPHPVVELKTKSKDSVLLTMMDGSPKGAALLAEAERILRTAQPYSGHFDGIRFPKVKLDQEADISWLKEMSTRTDDGCEFEISQALQQTKIAMNEKGARAKSAVAIAANSIRSLKIPKPDHIISKPFLFVLVRPGLARPLVTAHISHTDWKDPGDLKDL